MIQFHNLKLILFIFILLVFLFNDQPSSGTIVNWIKSGVK